MKTSLPKEITTIDEAKVFLTDLHKNGESFHPEDDATDLHGDPFTKEEGEQLNKLMDDIYNLKGNDGKHDNSIAFCPCGFLLDLDKPQVNIDNYETQLKAIHTDQTGGHIYNDVIELKNGFIIRISADGLSVHKNAQDDETGENGTHVEF